ncbi:radical SAM family heme chaperone HemW [Methylophilus medardicus]|uniref:Heme chaperone HemW n=1 Tax=Methylophilus medardicus TaxID=2588534 RepID=A0A5B8CPL9_9PROT|nr:radical SAM family heme chaperone HemW [Methylophilus medardicus]QDC43090.1 oxygen-independent coproporphyrinogen III oxidase-like protein [Methylophilus medardicus]QDC48097.1 oxygen-independent coproporphyrinogen III oxidase-like protein [Methylophilus medardicus]QDC51802.1 oxygen-independent coproporphyrinogen III oxidase-like protein [Methylophilus medardicus]
MIPIYPAQSLKEAPLQGEVTLSGLTNPPPLSLYIHIPWCVRKCPYCDFNSHEARQEIPEAAYVDALIADLEQATPLVWGRKIRSVFFGGGTPSIFSAAAIDKILSHVRMLTPLEYGAEVTLEANPGTVDIANFQGYRQAGVNRVSLGIQSFQPQYLQSLGRIHDREQALAAAELALNTFDQVNLDVMYALPQQSLADALKDAETACQLKPAHLSFYHLTLEPNTPFHRTPPVLPDDDTSATMQEEIEKTLASHGYQHYETSGFAQPGKQCVHNLNYWTFGDYLGIGAGAHSKLSFHDKIIRQSRHKHPKKYLESVTTGQMVDSEWQIGRDDLAFEFMMNALRLVDGVEAGLFQQRTGLPLRSIQATLQEAQQQGLMLAAPARIAPTLKGQRFLNSLLEMFLPE